MKRASTLVAICVLLGFGTAAAAQERAAVAPVSGACIVPAPLISLRTDLPQLRRVARVKPLICTRAASYSVRSCRRGDLALLTQ